MKLSEMTKDERALYVAVVAAAVGGLYASIESQNGNGAFGATKIAITAHETGVRAVTNARGE